MQQKANACRFNSNCNGHYESYFQRANHPTRPLAFWIRYTIYSPKNEPDKTVGEIWAIYFDGEQGQIVSVKEVVPWKKCQFSHDGLDVTVGTSTLREARMQGQASTQQETIMWDLYSQGEEPPLLLLPPKYYETALPKAKALVGTPNASYNGKLTVNGQDIIIDHWIGSKNHNWGSKHTDQYAWGQVAGFDNQPDAFLECSTARIKVGPFWTPWLTLIVLRYKGEEFALNQPLLALKSKGSYTLNKWGFDGQNKTVRISGSIEAPSTSFVALDYSNPPGGIKTCLNSKIAHCQITLERTGHKPVHLLTEHRAAFEILMDA